MTRAVMHQAWDHLLFVHWPIAPELLQRQLPPRLRVETFEGKAYLGLVAFTIRGLRAPRLPALPGMSGFHEVNLRTYVVGDGCDPGVWFFSLDAASRLAVVGARLWFRLKYHFARIRMSVGETGSIHYESRRLWPGPVPAGCALNYAPRGGDTLAQRGTLDHFLIERYVLYADAGGRLRQGRVAHAPYPLGSSTVASLDETLSVAAGLHGPRDERILHYSSGVEVTIHAPIDL